MAFNYKRYEDTDEVKALQGAYEAKKAEKPTNDYDDSVYRAALDRVLNREKFSYDLNGDAFYNQYKDKAVQQGKLAMQDAMAQASALTGGHGNSYATQAGQQAYQGYLSGVNDIVPELYQAARSTYDSDTQALLDQLSVVSADRETAYGRYRDKVSDHNTELQLLAAELAEARTLAQKEHATEQGYAYDDYAAARNLANEKALYNYQRANQPTTTRTRTEAYESAKKEVQAIAKNEDVDRASVVKHLQAQYPELSTDDIETMLNSYGITGSSEGGGLPEDGGLGDGLNYNRYSPVGDTGNEADLVYNALLERNDSRLLEAFRSIGGGVELNRNNITQWWNSLDAGGKAQIRSLLHL